MGVIGHEGRAPRRASAGKREGIRAGQRVGDGDNGGGGLQDRHGWPLARRERPRGQVRGVGNRRRGGVGPVERRAVFGDERTQEVQRFLTVGLRDGLAGTFVAAVGFQGHGHGVDDEHAILTRPRPRRGAQGEVFPGSRAEGGEAGVDPGDVGVDLAGLVGRHRLQDGGGTVSKSVLAGFPVHRKRERTEKLREFARALPPQQVHLEKPVLRVEEAQRAGPVLAAAGTNGGRPVGVALDGDRVLQRGKRPGPVERGQAGAHQQPTRDRHEQGQHHQQASQPEKNPKKSETGPCHRPEIQEQKNETGKGKIRNRLPATLPPAISLAR